MDTVMLVEFLRARLDEDEATARAVQDRSAPFDGQWEADSNTALRTANGHVLAHLPDGRPFKPGVLNHLARHDPARALQQTTALRAIANVHGRIGSHDWEDWLNNEPDARKRGCLECGPHAGYNGNPEGWCQTIRLLASVWSGHPDYQQEWAP
ncbi:DUF6221 family protein [Streptomyces sp. NBRC 109706]|uniref:DUF6221 family protein n=1 Tax=Streptomyces sp. NBRC 109706 TaxID=1550035 RepID=UPI000780E59D|nr:DUF6221 family protein [Streptomyces sp. NBRC 109706]